MVIARVTRAQRKEQTRDALVDSAYRLFTQQGFHGTSLDQVAAEAGFTKGAVYSNFASKEDLFFAVYERRVEASVQRLDALVDEFGASAPVESARQALAGRRSAAGLTAAGSGSTGSPRSGRGSSIAARSRGVSMFCASRSAATVTVVDHAVLPGARAVIW